ncbi:MAG: hypothetical protein ABEJ89_07450 [Haloarculaceae archaeon]
MDGTYTVWAGSLSGEATGSYTLSLQRVTGDIATEAGTGGQSTSTETATDAGGQGSGRNLRSISVGQTRQGSIDGSDPQDPVHGKRAEPVTLQLDTTQSLRIEMRSDPLDSYLLLTDGQGNTIAENDDIELASNVNSRIETTLDAGTYTIWCATFSGTETGPYTLSVTRQ